MAVRIFYNPDLVEQLAACGITRQRQFSPRVAAAGFVLDSQRNPARVQQAVTNVIAVRDQVTITGPRQQPLALPASTDAGPQSALALAEECTRLRRSNQLLTDEVARLRTEVERLTGASVPRQRVQDLDDSATRFSLLELDL